MMPAGLAGEKTGMRRDTPDLHVVRGDEVDALRGSQVDQRPRAKESVSFWTEEAASSGHAVPVEQVMRIDSRDWPAVEMQQEGIVRPALPCIG